MIRLKKAEKILYISWEQRVALKIHYPPLADKSHQEAKDRSQRMKENILLTALNNVLAKYKYFFSVTDHYFRSELRHYTFYVSF